MPHVRRSIVLACAFAALILVIGAASFAIWRNAMSTQNRVAALHDSHLQSGLALAAIRENVYLIGILTRDLLLDSEPAHAAQYDRQFRSIRRKIATDFDVLSSGIRDDAQRAAIDSLRRDVDAYWDPTALVLNWTIEQRLARRTEFLRERVRRREEITELAGQAERLLAENFAREKQRVMTANDDFRWSLIWIAAICLLLGAGIAAAAVYRVADLERRSDRSESELRRLSIQVRTAQEQERKFLSRELHDQVGQMLTGVCMELTSLARMHGIKESEPLSLIAHARGIIEQTLGMIRNIAMLLRPSMLDDLGLAPALVWLAKETSRTSGIEIETDIDPRVDTLPDAYRTCLYRVVQEALTNISRHSQALTAKVSLQASARRVTCEIADNGRGFDADTQRRSGLGLLGMEERIRELGGRLQVFSDPGRGTSLQLHLPIPEETENRNDSNPDRGRSWDRSSRVETSAGPR